MRTLSRGALAIRKKFPWLNDIAKQHQDAIKEAKKQQKLELIQQGKKLGVPDGYMLMPPRVLTNSSTDLAMSIFNGNNEWIPPAHGYLSDWINARRIPKRVLLGGLRLYDVIDVEFGEIIIQFPPGDTKITEVRLVLQRLDEVIEKPYLHIPVREMKW